MKKNYFQAEFIKGIIDIKEAPETRLPEIAFAGRSNVGKSSLINSIVYRKNLAYTSSTPGKTQEINFYLVNEKWYLVDLPGFGYAAKGKKFKDQWEKTNYEFILNRDNLSFICVLIDSRHDPSRIDMALIETLENHGKPYLIVLTKCDKISKTKVDERKEQVEHLVSKCQFNIEVLPYSSHTKEGREELLAIIKRENKKWNTEQK